jgi:hypothetical protein
MPDPIPVATSNLKHFDASRRGLPQRVLSGRFAAGHPPMPFRHFVLEAGAGRVAGH